jgi:phosphoribosylaminoimidazolecarboxamide formyltransferase/IMP cyclohydrolase
VTVNIVNEIDKWVRVQNALISVTDKRQLDILAQGLVSLSPTMRIFSTGGTYAHLKEILGAEAAGRHLVQVSDYTGQPETQGGLVKTLDFKIYLGLLTETYNPSHQQDLKRTAAVAIDLVAVNLYPFEQTIAKPGVTVEEARANIDIGGPCMLRAAAKNYLRVAAVVDPNDYAPLIKKMRVNGGRLDVATRFELARKAFAHTGNYDRAITGYLSNVPTESVERCYQLKESSV